MTTNEERKEIAARLRELSEDDGFAFDCILGETLGLEPCNSRCAECREAITNRLADLIELEPERTCETCSQISNPDSFISHLLQVGRTCRNIAKEDSDLEFICSECNYKVRLYEYGPEVGEHCEGCGAKVVE